MQAPMRFLFRHSLEESNIRADHWWQPKPVIGRVCQPEIGHTCGALPSTERIFKVSPQVHALNHVLLLSVVQWESFIACVYRGRPFVCISSIRTLFRSNLPSGKMHISTEAIVAIVSLVIAAPCTAILLWTFLRSRPGGLQLFGKFSCIILTLTTFLISGFRS